MHEVLFSRDKDLATAFDNEFQGMARVPVNLDTLLETRSRLRRELESLLTENHKAFLLSLVQGEPRWDLMRCAHLSELPSIRWNLQNLVKLKRSSLAKYALQAAELRARFGC